MGVSELTWGPGPGWSDDRIEALKHLWKEPITCEEIAKRLGGVTKSAVVGKAHRLGLPERPRTGPAPRPRPPKPPRPQPVVKAPKPRPPAPAHAPVPAPEPAFASEEVAPFEVGSGSKPGTPERKAAFEVIEGSAPRRLEDRPSGGCRWPVGAEFLSCSEAVEGERPYCPTHTRLAYQPRSPKRTPNELARSLRKFL